MSNTRDEGYTERGCVAKEEGADERGEDGEEEWEELGRMEFRCDEASRVIRWRDGETSKGRVVRCHDSVPWDWTEMRMFCREKKERTSPRGETTATSTGELD